LEFENPLILFTRKELEFVQGEPVFTSEHLYLGTHTLEIAYWRARHLVGNIFILFIFIFVHSATGWPSLLFSFDSILRTTNQIPLPGINSIRNRLEILGT